MKIDPPADAATEAGDRTPFDASAAPLCAPPTRQEDDPARRAAAQAELEAKMALLPDYGDEAFPRMAKAQPLTAPGAISSDEKPALGLLGGGFLGGVLGNIALGFFLLALRRLGVDLYGPGVLIVAVALGVLAMVAVPWPRRVWLTAAGFLIGLVLSFAALSVFLGPLVSGSDETRAPAPPPQNAPVPSPAAASDPAS